MHFESYLGDRKEWILKEAQSWLQEDRFLDLSITCGEAEGRRFKCHKIMFHQFLKQFLSLEHIEEVEDVVIPHLDPVEFKKYHSDVYGLESAVVNSSAFDVKVKLEEVAYEETEVNVGGFDEEDEVVETNFQFKTKYEEEDDDFMDEEEAEGFMDEDKNFEPGEKLGQKTKPRRKYQIKCRLCSKEYSRSEAYKSHFLKHHPEAEYITPLKQRKLEGVKKEFSCKPCEITFVSYKDLAKHRRSAHKNEDSNSEGVTCDLCGQTMKKHNFAAHKRSHALELDGNIVCSCGQTFSREIEFYQHKYEDMAGQERHSAVSDKTLPKFDSVYFQNCAEKYVPCDRCHEAFPNKILLRRHKLDSHWAELVARDMLYKESKNGVFRIKTLSCDFENCETYFREQQDKEVHMSKVHTGLRSHQCDQCTWTFSTAKKLRRHIVTNHEVSDDPVICQECGECFMNKAKLKMHWSAKHTAKKSIKCKFCDFSSTSRASLKEHERTHTGEKPETCTFCGQGFTSKRTRENHERLHTGEKPYACRYCDQAFVQRTSVNVHVQTHHKAEVASAGPKEKHFVYTAKKTGQRGRPATGGQSNASIT